MPSPGILLERQREGKYWDTRFRVVEEVKEKKINEFYANAEKLFKKAYARINKKLNAFFSRFADMQDLSLAEAKRLLTDPELEEFKMELNEYIKKGVENAQNFDPEIAKELERASIRYRVTRLEAMQYQLKADLAELFGQLDSDLNEHLADVYQDQYARTAYEIFKGTGVQKVDFAIPAKEEINLLIRRPWRADGSNFSERYGSYRAQLVSDLSDTIARVIINGEGYEGAAEELARKMLPNKVPGGPLYKARRLIHTESTYFSGVAQNECFKDLGVKKYQFRAELNTGVCANCGDLDGEIFDLKDRQVGVNAPPMHPFCVLPDTKVLLPGLLTIFQSQYKGDIYKIYSSDGSLLKLTPNHILLTDKGWVRAKYLKPGDILLSNNATIPGEPKSIADLYSQLTHSIDIKASEHDLKGDVVKDSLIKMVVPDSLFVTTQASKLLTDIACIADTGNSYEQRIQATETDTRTDLLFQDLSPFKFTEITKIETDYYEGAVYDCSTQSSMYLAENILVSNCRCVSVPYVDNKDIPGYIKGRRSGRNEKGKTTLFPENMTYKEWYQKVGTKLEENDNRKKNNPAK